MRYAVIENGIVSNIIEASGPFSGVQMVLDDGTAKIGGTYDGAFHAVVPSRDEMKEMRQRKVDSIKVTTGAGNTFDGDEISQGRMARAIIALQATGTPTVAWVLANNTAIQATAAELTEALALAGTAQAAIWVL